MEPNNIKTLVKNRYGKIAANSGVGCACLGSATSSGCNTPTPAATIGKNVGYSEEDLAKAPDGANLGLGCGNPTAIGAIIEGETVLDLGSGAGFDCFLAAQKVGPKGRVIGVDMTPEMVEKARQNARKAHVTNVEFRQGEIEALPVDDNSVDTIISNCVINLSPEKGKVFAEAVRVLRPGGRIMFSDLTLLEDLPEPLQKSIEMHLGCIAGAQKKADLLKTMSESGLEKIQVLKESSFPFPILETDPILQAIIGETNLSEKQLRGIAQTVVSLSILAHKPL